MARRKKKNALNTFLVFLLLLLIGLLCYRIYTDNINKNKTNDTTEKRTEKNNASNNDIDTKEEKKDEKNDDTKTTTNNVTDKSSTKEETETKNEVIRKGGSVKLELIGEEEITIDKGSKYEDAGFKAIYSDGSDASSEVEVDNTVDTSKEGTYTVSYYVGNSIVIRRVIVK